MIAIFILVISLTCCAALAVWNAQDVVPAATLLVPYAVVSTGPGNTIDPMGWTTLFSITNVAAQPQIVHITVWSARGAAVVDWNILLTGYDVWTIDFKDCLNGDFDRFDTGFGKFNVGWEFGYSLTPNASGPAANNQGKSSYPLPAAGFWAEPPANCGSAPPYGPQPLLGNMIRTKLRTGQAAAPDVDYWCSIDNQVAVNTTTLGWITANDPFFFYVIADVVATCTRSFPSDDAYWSANTINANNNVLLGDILYLNPISHFSEMLNAVHLEAYTPAPIPANTTTFYELDLQDAGVDAIGDTREPLGTEYAFRYATMPSPLQSNVIVWKNVNDIFDNGNKLVVDGGRSYRYWAWNEDELTKSHFSYHGMTVQEPSALSFSTQKIPVSYKNFYGLVTIASGGKNTGIRGAAGFGWMWIDFWSADKSTSKGTGHNLYEAYVAVEFVFGNYASAAAAPLLWTPYNRATIPVPANIVIPAQNAYTISRP